MPNQRIIFDSGKRKGMSEALSYVGNGWFPYNMQVLALVRKRLGEGFYEKSPDTFVQDLKTDVSLFTWALKRLQDVVPADERGALPTDLLKKLDAEAMKKIFEVKDDEISPHRFDPNQKPQMLAIRQTILSTTTAETIAEHGPVDPDLAFACGSVRQLGMNLIAFNYPRIFTKAIATIPKSGEPLDEALFKVLGYSPLQLGIRAALDWNKSTDLRLALGDADAAGATPFGEKLREICELGEAFARVNDPEHFPAAVKEFPAVMGALEKQLGKGGLDEVRSKLDRFAGAFGEAAPSIIRLEPSHQNLRVATSARAAMMLERNHYVSKCPPEVKELFRINYETLSSGTSATAVNVLVSQIVPALGFTRGCIYLVDLQHGLVVPKLRIGDAPLTRYRSLRMADGGSGQHPVVLALSYSAPIIQENAVVSGEQVSHVTGTFGSQERSGVLYLEMSPKLSDLSDRQMPLLYFKAVRECLKDCLEIP